MKIGYVLLDGCADRPNPRLNFTTPLESARTPNLDRMASSARLGRVVTVGRGIAPESDIAVFNMLGYSFEEGYPGRGVVEAVGTGLDFKNGDVAFRANLASVDGTRIVDRRAGRNLTQNEAKLLEAELRDIKLKDAETEYKATVSYRGVLVIRAAKPLSARVSNTDPAYSRVGGIGAARKTGRREIAMKCLPEERSGAAKRTAALVNDFTKKALKVLGASQVNRDRKSEGKLPANSILLRDAGDHLPEVETFEEKYGMKGTALVEMPAEVGIAKLLGMKMVSIEDRNDMKAKASLFSSELAEETVVYVHIKGPDEFGHDGDAEGKRRNIELIDRDFFSVAAQKLGDVRYGISCDHATPCTLKMHSSDPVPLLITGRGPDGMRFTEKNARKGTLGTLRGKDVLARVKSLD
jgi:2,3-bisphosphoglycerate-independent phosphoglycerate mutase